MVHYIRFLKPPRVMQPSAGATHSFVTALLTITTDLGDAFYPGDAFVHCAIFNGNSMTPLGVARWAGGSRVVAVDVPVLLSLLAIPFRFLFSHNASFAIDELLHIERLPNIIGAWTEEFSSLNDLDNADMTVRRLRMPGGRVLEVCEENGESMARHLWDGGVVLAAWLVDCPEFVQDPDADMPFSVLELGTGCGTVGLALGMHSNSHLILTDEDDDALVYARQNASISQKTFDTDWECLPFDWSKPDSLTLKRPLDFIIASECIYNSTTIPYLVRTMESLVHQSNRIQSGPSQPQIIVSTKVRHDSEQFFFDLMKAANFEPKQHVEIPIHDWYRHHTGQEFEVVHIYVFDGQGEELSSPEMSPPEGYLASDEATC
ncbi:MAG: hypothetical protein Q9169_005879 [Polycauliona sp. 2 TL-2023]